MGSSLANCQIPSQTSRKAPSVWIGASACGTVFRFYYYRKPQFFIHVDIALLGIAASRVEISLKRCLLHLGSCTQQTNAAHRDWVCRNDVARLCSPSGGFTGCLVEETRTYL